MKASIKKNCNGATLPCQFWHSANKISIYIKHSMNIFRQFSKKSRIKIHLPSSPVPPFDFPVTSLSLQIARLTMPSGKLKLLHKIYKLGQLSLIYRRWAVRECYSFAFMLQFRIKLRDENFEHQEKRQWLQFRNSSAIFEEQWRRQQFTIKMSTKEQITT